MTIDAKELREAIRFGEIAIRNALGDMNNDARLHLDWLQNLVTAASAYAATLPREVEVETWMMFDVRSMSLGNDHLSKDQAKHFENTNRVAVRLTGTCRCSRGTGAQRSGACV